MKKTSKLLLVFTFCVLIATGCSLKQDNSDVVKIRMTLPLTGSFAYYGQEVQRAFDLAMIDYKPFFDEKKIQVDLKSEDNAGDAKNSVANFQKFASEGGVKIIVSSNTPLSQPLIPLAESSKINTLALVTGAKDFAKDKKYMFRDAVMSDEQGVALGKYFRDTLKVNRVATIVVNDDYGKDAAKALKEEFIKGGGQVVSEENFAGTDTDLKTQILKVKNSKPDVILFVGREKSLIIGVKQFLELGISTDKIYSINAFESPTVFSGLGASANGIRFASMYYDLKTNPKMQKFFDNFKAKYGSEPGIYAIDAYSAAEYFIQSIADCGKTVDKINKCLTTEKFNTIKGEITFNVKHDASQVIGLYEIKNGKKELIQKVD